MYLGNSPKDPISVSTNAPAVPKDGDVWFNSALGETFVYYDDGNTSQWVQLNPSGQQGPAGPTGPAGANGEVARTELDAYLQVANLSSLSTSLIPSANVTYDLGSTTNYWKDLYLSGNTIFLGTSQITLNANGGIDLPSGSRMGGTLIGSGSGGASVTIADTAPGGPSAGDLWWSANTSELFIYYTDTDTSQWVQATTPGATGPAGAAGADGADGVDAAGITKSSSDPAKTTNGSLGDLWLNTTSGEMFALTDATANNNVWINIGEGVGGINTPVIASGGTETTITQNSINYKVHTFTSSGTFTVTQGGEIEYLVIGGGGGASGRDIGGGGGAGGYRCNVTGESSGGGASSEPVFSLLPGTYTITVGAGGAGGTDGGAASPGTNSVLSSITAIGGGAGKSYNAAVSNDGAGGSGGGASGIDSISSGTNTIGGVATSNQGFDGGDGLGSTQTDYGGGGGGGAGAVGKDAGQGKHGGAGVESSIDGTPAYRAGGGGGAGHRTTGSNQLGSGGNGGGAAATAGAGVDSNRNGASNTGGGAGAARGTSQTGGTGGTGIVIIRYEI